MSECVFCKIAAGEIPANKIIEDENIMIFHDISPAAPVHLLVVPKKHIPTVADCTVDDQALLGNMVLMANRVADQLGLKEGYRLIINNGKIGGQEVFHLHMHLLSGSEPLGRLVQG